MKKLVILMLCSASSLSYAATSPALIPAVGPHAVGLKIVQQYEASRRQVEAQ